MFSGCLVAWSFCHLGDVDLGVTAAEIDTTCLGDGSESKEDHVDLSCPEHFSQPSIPVCMEMGHLFCLLSWSGCMNSFCCSCKAW